MKTEFCEGCRDPIKSGERFEFAYAIHVVDAVNEAQVRGYANPVTGARVSGRFESAVLCAHCYLKVAGAGYRALKELKEQLRCRSCGQAAQLSAVALDNITGEPAREMSGASTLWCVKCFVEYDVLKKKLPPLGAPPPGVAGPGSEGRGKPGNGVDG